MGKELVLTEGTYNDGEKGKKSRSTIPKRNHNQISGAVTKPLKRL
jgi:hypothetical protein